MAASHDAKLAKRKTLPPGEKARRWAELRRVLGHDLGDAIGRFSRLLDAEEGGRPQGRKGMRRVSETEGEARARARRRAALMRALPAKARCPKTGHVEPTGECLECDRVLGACGEVRDYIPTRLFPGDGGTEAEDEAPADRERVATVGEPETTSGRKGGRPRKYRTVEERREANRLRSKERRARLRADKASQKRSVPGAGDPETKRQVEDLIEGRRPTCPEEQSLYALNEQAPPPDAELRVLHGEQPEPKLLKAEVRIDPNGADGVGPFLDALLAGVAEGRWSVTIEIRPGEAP